jgi:hypothetical protein
MSASWAVEEVDSDVLLIQDTTELDFTRFEDRNVGVIGTAPRTTATARSAASRTTGAERTHAQLRNKLSCPAAGHTTP